MPQPLESLISAAIVQVSDCIGAVDMDQAFIAATYESRITQYGRAAITKAALLSIRSQLQALLPPYPTDSMATGDRTCRAIPFQQDPSLRQHSA